MTSIDEAATTRARADTLTRAQRFGDGRTVIGVSSWGAALGVSPFVEPIELWRELVGKEKPKPGNEATELGEDLEDGVARNGARKLGATRLDSPPTLIHPRRRHFVATPDRIVTEVREGAIARPGDLIQVKTTYVVSPARRAHIAALWGEPGSSNVPEHVLMQCIGELWIARAWAEEHPAVWGFPPPDRNHVVALIGGRGVQVFTVDWDPELADLLVARVEAFWGRVIDEEPPPVDGSPAWAAELSRQHPRHSKGVWRVADAAAAALIRRLLLAVDTEKLAAEEADAARNLLKAKIGDAEGLRGPWGAVPWRTRRVDDEGNTTRTFGPVDVNLRVLDLAFPETEKTAAEVKEQIAAEVWGAKPEEEKAMARVGAALEAGDAVEVSDVLALPLAKPIPLVSPRALEALDRATGAAAAKKEKKAKEKQAKVSPWVKPLPIPPKPTRPPSCTCASGGTLGRSGNVSECYACGAKTTDDEEGATT